MSGKRPAETAASAGGPPTKQKKHTQFEPVQLGSVASLEEMDLKVLQFQNKKLAQRLEQRRRIEEDLRNRIEQLEKRQTTDDAVMCIVNRYWNQLDEDMRVVLQRFDWEVADESEDKDESEELTSFLESLSTWDRNELDQKLTQRVQFSERAVGKVMQCFDRQLQRYEKLVKTLRGSSESSPADIKLKEANGETVVEEGEEKKDDEQKQEGKKENEEETKKMKPADFDEVVREEIISLQKESKNLHSVVTSLHEKHRNMSLKFQELQDKVTQLETENAEFNNRIGDLEYAYDNSSRREEKLDRHLAEALQKLKNYEMLGNVEAPNHVITGVAQIKQLCNYAGPLLIQDMSVQELQHELEEQRQLAENRLQELEKLHEQHKVTVQELEKLKLDITHLPESVVVETAEYKCLQSQFSVLYNESMQMKTQLEETRNLLANSKNAHLRQIEQMESEELVCQKKLRTEVIQLEDALTQVRKEYEMLRIEFEQNLVANEQTGPINKEMRHLITSLQTNNQQLKGEVARYKKKWREAQSELNKIKALEQQAKQQKELEESEAKTPTEVSAAEKGEKPSTSQTGEAPNQQTPTKDGGKEKDSEKEKEDAPVVQVKKERVTEYDRERERHDRHDKQIKQEKQTKQERHEKIRVKEEPCVRKEKERHDRRREQHDAHERDDRDNGKPESEVIKMLKVDLKKAWEQNKEMKLLLDMYKGSAKEQRDKVQLMAAEKKGKADIDELRNQVRRYQESERKERKRLADDDAMRKIRTMEEQIQSLQGKLTGCKQEEDALLSDMELTGQAFEDMQEQNTRLLQQLREKDDAVFKLMSERIKSNQIHKLLKEEKDMIIDQVETLQHQVNAQNQVVRKLEEKEQLLQNNLATLEKELSLRQQAMEMHKRKAIESAQSAADLKLHLDKYVAQLRETQLAVAEKSSSLEQEQFKNKRIQEELVSLRRKLERHKKMELASSADEVLLEEIRDYKEQLTCPSCKTKKKDAVLTKCFHVFCFECIKTRYDTRQRKCPKCNAGFGANDFHRLYLS